MRSRQDRKGILDAVFCAVLVCFLLLPAAAMAEEWQATVARDNLPVYERMTRSSQKVAALRSRTKVIVEWVHEDMESRWCGIRLAKTYYSLGYVECKYLSTSDPSHASELSGGKIRPYSDITVILYAASW